MNTHFYKSVVRPYLFKMDAEKAHDFSMGFASFISNHSFVLNAFKSFYGFEMPSSLQSEYWGLSFKNPFGLAAGLDKNGTTIPFMEALGFGFIEIGSVTALPSPGNPKPRAFRLREDNSLINRMGLNNDGAEAIAERLKSVKHSIPLGINIAKSNNKAIHGDKAIADYAYSYTLLKPYADYITVNISCPNTGDGKTFEDPAALKDLLEGLPLNEGKRKPTLLKFSVDTDNDTLSKLIEIAEAFDIDGYVATNTSNSRTGLQTSDKTLKKIGNGGLSGEAIRKRSTAKVHLLTSILKGKKPIIGVGGISDADSAKQKMDAGADLVQFYTGLVYEGPGLLKELAHELGK